MSKAADDYEAIRRRLEELAAEKNLALTGSTLEEKKEEPKGFDNYGMYVWPDNHTYWCKNVSYEQAANQYSRSLAHPQWPYTGTAHEWRGFVKTNG